MSPPGLAGVRYLLDTNLCIHLIQQRPPEVLERFRTLRYGDVLLSAVTLAELRHGVELDPREKEAAERALALLLSFLPVRWGKVIENDPYYSPHLTLRLEDFSFDSRRAQAMLAGPMEERF